MRYLKPIGILLLFTIFSLSFSESLSARSGKRIKRSTKKPIKTRKLVKNQTEGIPTVRYAIDAQLLPSEKKLIGSETIRWTNKSDITVNNLQFHLYYNAFRNEKTSFLTESDFFKKTTKELKNYRFGEIKIKEMRIVEGEELTAKINYISQDDQNKEDRTVMEVYLKEPVKPYHSIEIKISFTLTIPEIISLTGYEDDFFFMAQWFPKIGVLQKDGKWNCHQYHKLSQFFSDFGEYKIALTIPEKYIIGATGNLENKIKNADGTYTFVFEEKNIHDFAWVAYPYFKEIVEKIKLNGNRDETKIILLLSPHHEKAIPKYLNSLKFTMQYYAKHIFPYPYKTITIVDPPLKAWKSAKKEYPTLLSLGYNFFLPDCIRQTEMITIHMFGHQYWYGMIGTDEAKEAWLVEGINSFFEMETMDKYFNNSNSYINLPFLGISCWQYHRYNFLSQPPVDKVNQDPWQFLNNSTYSGNVNSKAGILLRSLKNHVGQKKMMDFFQFYAKKFRYKNPKTEDFINTFNQFMGSDFSWAFNQFILDSKNLDHAIYSVESNQIQANPDRYRNEVILLRNEGYFPVELLIKLKDGREIKQMWEEKNTWKKLTFEDNSAIDYATLDPEHKIPLDKNILNNSKTFKQSKGGIHKLAVKLGFLFQNLLSCIIL